jgi:hypothetical protein
MRIRHVIVGATLLAGGCWWDEPKQQYAPKDVVRGIPSVDAVNANTSAGSRVDSIGTRILAENPQIAAKPLFRTIGSPEPEIFHQGMGSVIITQKLVDLCPTDAELAAVICMEFGKMVAEREALAPLSRKSDLPPISPGLPASVSVDQFRQAELADYEKRRGGHPSRDGQLPDPEALARIYLQRAGFAAADLETVRTQLKAASANSTLENQSRATQARSNFAPPQQ